MRFSLVFVAWPVQLLAIVINQDAGLRGSPGYDDAVECSQKTSALADESKRLMAENQNIERECQQSLRHYQNMINLVDKTISAYETSIERKQKQEGQWEKTYTDRYTASMCAKTYDAFFVKDEDSRMEVLHICSGRKSLAPKSLLRHRSDVHKTKCPQDQMQNTVDRLRAAKEAKVAKCKKDKAELRNTLAQKRAREDTLEDQYYGHHESRTEARTKAGREVEAKFCPVVMQNYHLNEVKIQEFWKENCA
jgi:hypothetical protein